MALLLLLASSHPGHIAATTLRCGVKVIQTGDADSRVLAYCGPPISIERDTRSFAEGGRLDDRCFHGIVTVEKWHYQRGAGGLPATIFIVDGKVERISFETGGFDAGWVSPCR